MRRAKHSLGLTFALCALACAPTTAASASVARPPAAKPAFPSNRTARGKRAHRSKPVAAVSLKAAFTPERLGKGTTVHVSFTVTPADPRNPQPVTDVQLLYPRELGLGTSDLGLESCLPEALAQDGPAGCPPNSRMGRGSAVVEVPFGPKVVLEKAPIEIFSQPVQAGRLGLLLFASGDFPVIADLAFGAQVLPAGSRYGGVIDTKLPPVPSVPNGPDVALVGLATTIGPEGLLYVERLKGKLVRFRPEGIRLPERCPRGGFPFAVKLTFQDASTAGAQATVPCPRRRRRGH